MDRRSLWILGFIFGGLFLSLFGFLVLAWIAVRAGDEGPTFRTGPVVAVVEVKGVISDVERALKHLRKAERDDHVKAVLVRIDSPGGAVAPSQELYSELRRVGGRKKTVCSLGNVAASGGFYVAMGCQKVLASPGTLTGSIGVIAQMPFLGDVAQELKFRMVTIKAGKLKDVGNPFREMTDDERGYFQGMLDAVHEQFIAAVAEGRGLKADDVRPVADGRILTGLQAKELGLVDEIGNFNDAVRLAASLSGIEGEPRLSYPPEEKPFAFEELLREGARAFIRGARAEVGQAARGGGDVVGPLFLAPGLPTP